MSIARAFTTRRNKHAKVNSIDTSSPGRSQSTRKPGMPIKLSDISGPVALISTTNMLSYNAPDISSYRHASSSSAASSHSSDESDARSTSSAHDGSSTDASSVGSSPVSPSPPKINHLSGYFAAATNYTNEAPAPTPTPPAVAPLKRSSSIANLPKSSSSPKLSAETSPAIPRRALSHSKAAHERLSRQRSLRSSSSSPRLSKETRSSLDIFKVVEDPTHPFGKELEQLKEVVEEFGGVVIQATNDEDDVFMQEHKLAKFEVSDYLSEIRPLFVTAFNKQVVAIQAGWI